MSVLLKLKYHYFFLFVLLLIASFYAPKNDPKIYFQFADQWTFRSIPHFLDVATNLIFFISGTLGLFVYKNCHQKFNYIERLSFLFFSYGSILLCLGSGYFHWTPNPYTLVWDRVPMVICFNSLITFIIADRVETKGLLELMILFLLLGLITTFGVPYLYQSLRPYYLFQLGTIIFTVILTFSFKEKKISNLSLISMFLFYVLAKLTETFDHQIYNLLKFITGHNLKHLLAGAGMIFLNINLYLRLKK